VKGVGLSLASEKTSVGFVTASIGDVYIYHKDMPLGLDVIATESVYPGDLIVTGEGSRSKIQFDDESVLSIGENSRLKIKEYLLFNVPDRDP
jgi:hypothetical protein